jgi:aerobic-type carbon monoxide dehydrogenase small subunit (CoxS/CutS family)
MHFSRKVDGMIDTISFRLNGKAARVTVDTERSLLWVLRSDLGLTGTKYGCGAALCGACTVLVGKEAVRSCQMPVKEVQGKEVLTIEGLGSQGKLHPLQEAFIEKDALQCGFCTPGMILNAYSLLLNNSAPSRGEIISAMDFNLCRCGSYNRIIEAIETAGHTMKGAGA